MHNSRLPLNRLTLTLTLTMTFDLIFIDGRGIVVDYPCAKFGDFIFSRFGFIVRTNRHTESHRDCDDRYRVAQKTGPPSHCKYSEIPRPNCIEIVELLHYYMLNTVINFLFKNFIALWRHLAKTPLLSFIHIYK